MKNPAYHRRWLCRWQNDMKRVSYGSRDIPKRFMNMQFFSQIHIQYWNTFCSGAHIIWYIYIYMNRSLCHTSMTHTCQQTVLNYNIARRVAFSFFSSKTFRRLVHSFSCGRFESASLSCALHFHLASSSLATWNMHFWYGKKKWNKRLCIHFVSAVWHAVTQQTSATFDDGRRSSAYMTANDENITHTHTHTQII